MKHDRVIKLPGRPFSTNDRSMPYKGPIRAFSTSISVHLFVNARVRASGEARFQYWRFYEIHKSVVTTGINPRVILRCFNQNMLFDSRPHDCYTCAYFVAALVAFKATKDDYLSHRADDELSLYTIEALQICENYFTQPQRALLRPDRASVG